MEHGAGSLMITFTVSVSFGVPSQGVKKRHFVSLFLFPPVLPSSIKSVLFSACLRRAHVALLSSLSETPSECGVTLSKLYPTPLFEVPSLPGFELPFVFYPAQRSSPEPRLV